MKTDAIIFDKDGTLLDFDAFWVTVTEQTLLEVLERTAMEDTCLPALMEALGVRNGVTDMDGALCKGTYREIGHIVYDVLAGHGCAAGKEAVVEAVISGYDRHAGTGKIRPTCPRLEEVLEGLKAQGKLLALVTTDNPAITEKCLKGLGIHHLFDMIYTDDGSTPTKPDPWCANALCQRFGLQKQRVVMVGDTMTDVRFARNAGIAVVGLARTEKNRAALLPVADGVIDDMTQLQDALDRL